MEQRGEMNTEGELVALSSRQMQKQELRLAIYTKSANVLKQYIPDL
jgi:hypothetical protein